MSRTVTSAALEIRELWRIMRNGGKKIGRKALEVIPFGAPDAESRLAELAEEAEMPYDTLNRNWRVMAQFVEDPAAGRVVPDDVSFSVLEEILRGDDDKSCWDVLAELQAEADASGRKVTVDLLRSMRGHRPTTWPRPPRSNPFDFTTLMSRVQIALEQVIELADDMEPFAFSREWQRVLEGEVSSAEMKLALLRSKVTAGDSWEVAR